MRVRECEVCGQAMQVQRSTKRFCSSGCRARVAEGRVVPMVKSPPSLSPTGPTLVAAVRADLRRADAESTGLGAAALLLAERIALGQDQGSAHAALNRELRATLVAATRGQVHSGLASLRDELAERRARVVTTTSGARVNGSGRTS